MQKLIIFEGVDKTGKSTLINLFNKKTNYKYWLLDRCCISSYVYDILFKRNNLKYWNDVIKNLKKSFDLLVVYCQANEEDIKLRLNVANEELPKELQNIQKVNNLFLITLDLFNINYIKLNTSTMNIKECLEKIQEGIDKL